MLWAALLFGGFLFGEPEPGKEHRIPTWARMGSSFMLALAAWSWWLIADFTDFDRLALLFAVGMSFGLLGDLFMARLIIRSEHYVLGGMGAFAMGHIAYITGLLTFADVIGLSVDVTVLVVCWIVAVVLWYLIIFRPSPMKEAPHFAALPYALLLATTAGVALSLSSQSAEFLLLAVGAVLFFISDLILAAHLFSHLKLPMVHDVVWLTYGPAQMLLIFTIPFQSIL